MGRLKRIKDDASPTPNVLAEYSYDELSRRTLVTLGNDANVVCEWQVLEIA